MQVPRNFRFHMLARGSPADSDHDWAGVIPRLLGDIQHIGLATVVSKATLESDGVRIKRMWGTF